jgi:phosphoribosylformylglycinamidine synthase
MAAACRALDIPIVSGNVSLYNETPDGPILPTPVVGMIGLLDDRSRAVPMAWHEGDELWLLGSPGADASSLAGSERASRDATLGGAPSLDVAAAARLVTLLGELSRDRVLAAAHDVSIGGIAVAAARMAIAAGVGAQLSVARRDPLPTAAWFGERGGRVLVAVADHHAGARLSAAAADAGVTARRLGSVGGETLDLDGRQLAVTALRAAWETPFAS